VIEASFLDGLKKASARPVSFVSSPHGVTSQRRGQRQLHSRQARLRLVESGDDLVEWVDSGAVVPGLTKRRRGSGSSSGDSAPVMMFERIAPSMIASMLVAQDAKFTPSRGIWKYDGKSKTKPLKTIPAKGRVLLLIHGTFSNGDNQVKALEETDAGRNFLEDALKKYQGQVLLFNHPTLSVSPLVNAVELQRLCHGSSATIDIVAHSRGGLVARWWCENFDSQMKRCQNAIMVGSPLAGTGLAAPPNIRKTIKLLSSYGRALSAAGAAATAVMPVLGLVTTLLQVVTSVTSMVASTPIADALVAMVPGLCTQSRVGNNPELLQLHQSFGNVARYAAVQANFESEEPGWRFWKYFGKSCLADLGSDLIFDGMNDMVVDTPSMTFLADESSVPKGRVLDFGTTNRVHHVNYFSQPETIGFLKTILKIG
jgi:pimeloyl-ACP methyl ester carboxylesterase